MHRKTESARLGESALRLLLGAPCPEDDWEQLDWDLLVAIARTNCILIRTCDALRKKGVAIPPRISAMVHDERQRVEAVMGLVKKISHLCRTNGIPFLLPTVFQHSPDMGGDIDLLAIDSSRNIDGLLRRELRAQPLPKNCLHRIASESTFLLDHSLPSIEVHHGRIGLGGEHRVLPSLMAKHQTGVSIDGLNIPAPSPEDQLLYQALQRIYCRFYYRISDLIFSITLLGDTGLNWDYVLRTAATIGVSQGLGVYLRQIDTISHEILGRSLLPEPVAQFTKRHYTDGLVFQKSYYRYSMLAVTSQVYLRKIADDLRAARFGSLLRLCFIPSVALIYLLRNACGRRSRYFAETE